MNRIIAIRNWMCWLMCGKSHTGGELLYDVVLNLLTIPNLPGLPSFAFGLHQGQWLIMGGRKDGLHTRQPFNAFPASMNNTDVYVIDPTSRQLWTASVASLPTSIQEPLQSTDINFHQDGDIHYIVGGYGFAASVNGHIGLPYLTTITVSGVIQAIKNNQPLGSIPGGFRIHDLLSQAGI